MRAGVVRFILICILVFVVGLATSAAVPLSVVLTNLAAQDTLINVSGMAAPSAVSLVPLDKCNDLSCG